MPKGARSTVPIRFHTNWVGIRHLNGSVSGKLPITAQVGPFVVMDGVLKVREQLNAVKRGDANIDGELDLSHALALINHLFLGGPPPDCPRAADFNLDSALDISDPIAILDTLFQGKPPAGGVEPAEVPCR